MPDCKVTLIANAGILIQCAGKKVLIDPLHNVKAPAFSIVTPELAEHVYNDEEFANPDIIIVTHDHPDHYSREMIAKELEKYPDAVLFAPFDDFPDQEILTGDRIVTEAHGVRLDFKKIIHEGKQYRNVPHYACIMDFGGFTVLDVGDSQTGDEDLAWWAAERNIDLAVLTFPWYDLHKGRDAVDYVIKPRDILLMHLPFEKDDDNRFRASTLWKMREDPSYADLRIMLEPLQTEIFS